MTACAFRVLLGAALLVAAPAPGAPFKGFPGPAAEAERMMADFSKCVIGDRRLRPWAERFLRLIPDTQAFRDAGFKLATPECMSRAYSNQLRFNAKLFRQTLFSALYQRDFGRTPPPDLTQVPTLVLAAEFDGDATAIPPTVTFEREVGDCVARADPADVHRLLMTRITSDEEKAALQQVVPQLARCVPAGARAEFSRSVLRGFLAEALYKLRRAAAARASGAAAQ